MTAYNREKYIASAIKSVLAQTFGDFELLIVDDGSQDRTVEIAQACVTDSRIRVVVNKRNLGQFANRNHAAQLALGQYLKYQDSDDLMYPHCLATMLGPLASEPRAHFALSNGSSWPGGPCPMLLTPRMCYQREFLGFGMFQLGPSCALFRAEVFRNQGGFPEEGVGSDYLFWLKACAKCNVLLLPADVFWYRIHPSQQLRSTEAKRDYAILCGRAWRALQASECPLSLDERERAKRNLVYILAKTTLGDLKVGRWNIARLRLEHADLSWLDWARYLRLPQRDRLAGTLLDETGEYLVPDWSHFRLPPECSG